MASPRLVGSRVVLRAPVPGDLEVRRSLGYHSEIERGYGHVVDSRPMTADEAHAWFDAVTGEADADCYWHIQAGEELAGAAFLTTRSHDRKARFAIGMFTPAFVGRGLGQEATRLVLRHAFDGLGLHRVDLRVLAFNTAAIRCYRSCGFVEEGRERESCLMAGEWYDDVMMAVLEHEFRAVDRAQG